jgi:hypothetical protein
MNSKLSSLTTKTCNGIVFLFLLLLCPLFLIAQTDEAVFPDEPVPSQNESVKEEISDKSEIAHSINQAWLLGQYDLLEPFLSEQLKAEKEQIITSLQNIAKLYGNSALSTRHEQYRVWFKTKYASRNRRGELPLVKDKAAHGAVVNRLVLPEHDDQE